jgi:hypothetical protein
MLNAARVQGSPTMVIAMRTAAITQPIAIHRPPKTIHNMLSKRDRVDISFFREHHHAGYKRDLGIEAQVCQSLDWFR